MHDVFDAIEELVVRPQHSPQWLKRTQKEQTHQLLLHGVPTLGLGILASVIDMSSSNSIVEGVLSIAVIPLCIWSMWVMWCGFQLLKTIIERRWWTAEPTASINASAFHDTVNIMLTLNSAGFPYWQPRIIEHHTMSVDEALDKIPETVARLEHNRDILNQNIPRIWRERTILYAHELEEQELLLLTEYSDNDNNPQDIVETHIPRLPMASAQQWSKQQSRLPDISHQNGDTYLIEAPDYPESRHEQARHIAQWINGRHR